MRFTIPLILIYIVFSCNANKNGSLLIINTQTEEPSIQGLSNVFNKNRCIKLETPDSIIIANIGQILMTKDFIIIAESKRVFQFDISGRFIRQIGRYGHGPGEHMSVFNVAVDTSNKRLIIASIGLNIYDFNGNFIQSPPQNRNSASQYLSFVNGNLWSFCIYNTMEPIDNNKKYLELGLLYKYNEKLQISDSIVLRYILLDRLQFAINAHEYYLSDLKTGTYIYYPVLVTEPILRDTLYEIRGSNLIPIIKLDFSSILSIDKNAKIPIGVSPEASQEAEFNIRSVTIRNIYRTKQYIFAEYDLRGQHFLFCYDLIQKKDYHMPESFTDDLYGIGKPVYLTPLDLQKGEFCFIKNGYELEGFEKGIGEESNPVIFLIETKE